MYIYIYIYTNIKCTYIYIHRHTYIYIYIHIHHQLKRKSDCSIALTSARPHNRRTDPAHIAPGASPGAVSICVSRWCSHWLKKKDYFYDYMFFFSEASCF